MSRHGGSSRHARAEEGVSPVIGSILILTVILVAMATVLGWGMPAIQSLQEHSEFQSVQTQMLQLNQELRSLRDPQNTRVATLSLAQGNIRFDDGDRWVVSVMTNATYTDIKLQGYEDDDTTITVAGIPGGVSGTATMERVVGGKFTSLDSQACTGSCALSNATLATTDDVLRFQFQHNSVVVWEAWFVNMGRITYDQTNGRNLNHLELGASIIEQIPNLFLRASPTIKEPLFTSTPPDNSFFVRLIEVRGTDVVGGRAEFNVLLNLIDNYGASRGRPVFEEARMVRFQSNGFLEAAFCDHFVSKTSFAYDGSTSDCLGGDADVLYNPGQAFHFELSHGVVNGIARIA